MAASPRVDPVPQGRRLGPALFTIGSVVGPLLALGILLATGDYRLVFRVAVIPAILRVAVLVFTVTARSTASAHTHVACSPIMLL
jgi:MFS family permease